MCSSDLVLPLDLGPWAKWVLESLGGLVQIGVVATWAIVGFAILAAPVWLLRRRRVSHAGPVMGSGDAGWGRGDERDRQMPWRSRDGWKRGAAESYDELRRLRELATGMVDNYRSSKRKKWEKKRRKDCGD